MNKIDLVFHPNGAIGFRSYYFSFLFSQYFNYWIYDTSKVYDKNTIFVSNIIDDKEWINELRDNGYKTVIDNLWEFPNYQKGHFNIVNKNWFWYNECFWNDSLGYSSHIPNVTYKKLAFMPINRKGPNRDAIIEKLKPYLDDFIYSYGDKKLPNDLLDKTDPNWQRYFNPEWYNDTYFSLVIETSVNSITDDPFITEKTFKPIAFKHPFMVYGTINLLGYIKSQGFVTYDNLFDESYDMITDNNSKINEIIKNITNFNRVPYDKFTLEKIEHNHALFFNKDLVISKIKKEIINPLIEYAKT